MAEITARPPADELVVGEARAHASPPWWRWWPVAVPAVLALGLFLWQLGSPSLFIDEVYSWRAAAVGVGELLHRVRVDELAPPTYYLLLHGWIQLTGSDSEWAMRLLSVLAGVGVVASITWLGGLLGGRRTAVLSGLLAALSPLVLQYSQEARAYVFAMLGVTIAVAAAVQASRCPESRGWMILSAAAAMVALWFHYTAALVVLPLEVWVWFQGGLSRRARRGHIAAASLGFLIVLPWFALQVHRGHQGGVAPYARLTLCNLLAVIGTPFDGRYAEPILLRALGAVAVLAAVGLLASRWARPVRARWLIVGAAGFPVLFVVALTAFAQVIGQSTYTILISRYTAVATPFMLVAIAIVALSVDFKRVAALALLVAVAVPTAVGVVAAHQREHFWTDLRDPFAEVSADYKSGDVIELSGYADFHAASDYYLARLMRRHPQASVVRPPTPLPASGSGRVWVISDPTSVPPAAFGPVFQHLGYQVRSVRLFVPSAELALATRPG